MMKKIRWISLLGLVLSLAFCVPALAQTTGIAVDGKTYTFIGSEGTYEADGKTFIIGADTVTIKEAGKADRTLTVSRSCATESSIAQDTAVIIESTTEQGETSMAYGEIVIAQDTLDATVSMEQAIGQAEDFAAANGQTAMTEYSQTTYENVPVDPTRYDEYAQFGLSYDAENNALYYHGQRVRIFEDAYSLDDQSCTSLEHVDDQGTIDLTAQRDMSATLTGLYVLTDAEYAARNLSDWTEPKRASTAVEGEMTLVEKEALYAPYVSFGLRYDAKTDTLTYRGQLVRQFTDIRQSNGENLENGSFHGVMTQMGFDNGEVDVETIRDYSKPDANGDGMLIGLSSEEVR